MKKVVKVYGALKKRLGKGRFEFVANTPAEAIRALCSNFPGLDKWLIDSEKDGVAYRVKVGKEMIEQENISNLSLPWSAKDVFSIRPVIAGAGGGFGKVLAGAVLIGAAFMTGGATFTLAAGLQTTSFLAQAAVTAGTFLALGGVSQMLTPTPTMPDYARGKEANRLESFTFSGIVNVSKQGMAIPIVYGRCYVGSCVLSSGLDVDQVQA
tara:strand:+ start:166 stop:795 length:630 start_codon:yes stop_codon:yes gene_type:complete